MKVTWHGTISFGLVSVPVGLVVAQDRERVSFRQIHRGCGERINLVKICQTHGQLTTDDVVRGYEYESGKFFEVPEGEIDATRPDASKVIEVKGFVEIDAIDPLLRDRTYYLHPAKEANAREGYVLLVQAMENTKRAALASFVLWGRENLCTVRSAGGHLLLDLLYYANDVRDSAPLDVLLDGVGVSKEAVTLAEQLVKAESIEFDHNAYFSDYHERLRAMLDEMARGKPKKKTAAKAKPKVADTDLLAALRASLPPEKKKPTTRRKVAAGR
jgi:DNA end-binding protein Ku